MISTRHAVRKFKIAPGLYHLKETYDGPIIATIVKTGTRRDNYPWEWYLGDGIRFKSDKDFVKGRGNTESLKVAVDIITTRYERYGVEMES